MRNFDYLTQLKKHNLYSLERKTGERERERERERDLWLGIKIEMDFHPVWEMKTQNHKTFMRTALNDS